MPIIGYHGKPEVSMIENKPITESQFIKTMFGCMRFGLDEEEAKAIVDKGMAYADFFEETAIAGFYPSYKESGLPIDVWAIRCPSVILEKYKNKAQNKEALEIAMGRNDG